MIRYTIAPDPVEDTEALSLLQLHLDQVHAWSDSCKLHALPAERLRQPDVTFFVAKDGKALAAIGALRELGEGRGELKSMRAADAYRGKGAGNAILRHLVAEARSRGLCWLGLETGPTKPFEPARALYRKNGFAPCAPFGDYLLQEFGMCMEKHL